MMRSAAIALCTAMVFAAAPSTRAAIAATTAIQPVGSADRVDLAIAEASLRFGVPASWIRAVIRAESFGKPGAVSVKGAVGLMQVMPSTYAGLRSRLRLGSDPFDVHDNVLAGTAYLRLMFDRFGVAGMVGGYNAGPERWQAYLAGAQVLPSETVGYLSRLAPVLGFDGPAMPASPTSFPSRSPFEAPIFVGSPAEDLRAQRRRVVEIINRNTTVLAPSGVLRGSTALTAERPVDGNREAAPPLSVPLSSAADVSSGPPVISLFAPVSREQPRP